MLRTINNCSNFMLLHDKASAQKALVAKATLRAYGFEDLSHPSIRLDFTPCDIHPFPNYWKGHVRGKHF